MNEAQMAESKQVSPRLMQRVILGLLAFLSFAIVVILRWQFEGPFVEALSAAFEALLIAAILALTVDPFLKREFFREASADIFLFWLGYSLPHQINDFLHSFVSETKLLRRDCVLCWTVEEQPNGRVRLELDVSYVFQNVTNRWQSYDQEARVFDSSPEEQSEVLEMRCIAPSFPELDYQWGPRDFQSKPDGYLAGPNLSIPPQRFLDGKAKAGATSNQIIFGMKYASLSGRHGSDIWRTQAPTMNLSVICKPTNKFVFSTDLQNAKRTGDGSWEVNDILMKGHGFSVYWKPM
jgi:hypothetical protein